MRLGGFGEEGFEQFPAVVYTELGVDAADMGHDGMGADSKLHGDGGLRQVIRQRQADLLFLLRQTAALYAAFDFRAPQFLILNDQADQCPIIWRMINAVQVGTGSGCL